jgi:hypothetical protein
VTSDGAGAAGGGGRRCAVGRPWPAARWRRCGRHGSRRAWQLARARCCSGALGLLRGWVEASGADGSQTIQIFNDQCHEPWWLQTRAVAGRCDNPHLNPTFNPPQLPLFFASSGAWQHLLDAGQLRQGRTQPARPVGALDLCRAVGVDDAAHQRCRAFGPGQPLHTLACFQDMPACDCPAAGSRPSSLWPHVMQGDRVAQGRQL